LRAGGRKWRFRSRNGRAREGRQEFRATAIRQELRGLDPHSGIVRPHRQVARVRTDRALDLAAIGPQSRDAQQHVRLVDPVAQALVVVDERQAHVAHHLAQAAEGPVLVRIAQIVRTVRPQEVARLVRAALVEQGADAFGEAFGDGGFGRGGEGGLHCEDPAWTRRL